MAAHNDLGKIGEDLAEKYFVDRGYEILDRNWTHFKKELDLVAVKEEVLHFIEVKTRSSDHFGRPEDAVDDIKISFLIAAGEEYLYQHPEWKKIRFDVLSICIQPNGDIEYFLIEDVYG